MLRLVLMPFALVLGMALPARAASPAELDALLRALSLSDLVAIMREEGLQYGDDLEAEMFAGRGGDRWDAAVARIYETDRMQATLAETLGARLGDADIAPLVDFFGSDTGARIVGLELSARRALLDPAVKEASLERLEEMQADTDPRLEMVERFVEANALVEANVAGALNANFAFYTGLADGRAFDFEMTEDEMLSSIWGQEPEIRADTVEWLFSYLAMAYAPLSDDTLESYIALSETAEGRALNTALFEGFDRVFTRISRELGLVAATFIAGQDI